MKRVSSVFLALVMCLVMAVPAFAAGPQEAVSVTKVSDSLLEGNYETSFEGIKLFDETGDFDMDQAIMPMGYIPDLISPEVSPLSVQVYPVIFVPEEGAGYILNDCGRYKKLSGTTQAEMFNLSTTATTAYINEIASTIREIKALSC